MAEKLRFLLASNLRRRRLEEAESLLDVLTVDRAILVKNRVLIDGGQGGDLKRHSKRRLLILSCAEQATADDPVCLVERAQGSPEQRCGLLASRGRDADMIALAQRGVEWRVRVAIAHLSQQVHIESVQFRSCERV